MDYICFFHKFIPFFLFVFSMEKYICSIDIFCKSLQTKRNLFLSSIIMQLKALICRNFSNKFCIQFFFSIKPPKCNSNCRFI